jgi:hypothetical protein
MEDTNVPDGNTLADKVKINLNMLGALVLNGVGGEVDGADVVAVDQSGPRQGAVQLHKQLSKPTRPLPHHWPRRGNLPQHSNGGWRSDAWRTRRRGCCPGITGPVSNSVDDEVRRRGMAKKQAEVEGALEVPKDALCGREMGLMRVVHVEAHLLDRVGNAGPGEGEVLESPSQAAVGSRVAD